MSLTDTQELARLIDAKHACLSQLRDVVRQQEQFVQDGNLTELMQLLGGKQSLLGTLADVERLLDRFRPQAADQRQWSSSEARQRCARQADECNRLLRELLEAERQCEDHLKLRRDHAADRLNAAHWSHQARGAYAGSMTQSHSHIALSSEG